MIDSRFKRFLPSVRSLSARQALIAAIGMGLLGGCNSLNAATPAQSSTTTVASVDATGNANQTRTLQLIEQQLLDIRAQLDGMQNQINELRSQQLALTQLISAREATRPASYAAHAEANLDSRKALLQAQNLYRAGLYAQAVTALRDADSGGNGSQIAQERMLLLMQSHWRLHNCESVINIGNRFVSRFADHPQAPESLYRVGQCQARMQQRDMAHSTWRKLMAIYPDSAAAKKAWQQLKP